MEVDMLWSAVLTAAMGLIGWILRSAYAEVHLLCKPNVVYMMLICALVGMLLAEETISSVSTILIALIGIALCSGSAAAINQVIDRKADAP